MKLPGTFQPKQKSDDKLEELLDSDPFYPGALAIAVSFTYQEAWATDIMVWTPEMDEPEKVARRFGYVQGLCVYENLLYDAGENRKVIDTLNRKVVARRENQISSLCVHKGVMYDGGLKEIFKTDEGKLVAKREGWVKALRSCNGELYDAGSYRRVVRTFDNYTIAERKDWIYALGSQDNKLYDATEKGISNTFKKKTVTRRRGIPFTLFSFNNKLYDGGQYPYIYETSPSFFKKRFLRTDLRERYNGVTAVQPISFWLANQLLRKA